MIPLPDSHSASGQEPALAASPAHARKFCPTCGAVWNPLWLVCPRCEAQAHAVAAIANDTQRPKRIGPSLALYFSLLVVSIVAILTIRTGEPIGGVLVGLECVDAALVLLWCAADWTDLGPVWKVFPGIGWYAAALAGALLTFGVAVLSIHAIQHMFAAGMKPASDPFLSQPYGWAGTLLLVAVQPAVIEELAFRGIILTGLLKVLHKNEAILVSAGLFMILHLSVLSFPYLFVIGAVLGYLRVKTGSLYPGMLLHFTHNMLCLCWGRLLQ